MSLALQALGGEVQARGSMLKDAATAWLSRHHKVESASKAHAMLDDGAKRGYFRLDDGALFPAERENPACKCKGKVHEAVGAVPTRLASKVAPRENPVKPTPAPAPKENPVKACPVPKVPKGKLSAASRSKIPTCAFADEKGKRFPIHDLGHAKAATARLAAEFKRGNVSTAQYKRFHKRIQDALRGFGIKVSGQRPAGEKQNPASTTQETTPMAKARKAKKAKTARKSPKKRRTAAQKAATKRMLAANKKARKTKPAKAKKAAKPRARKAAKPRTRKSPARKRKATPRKRAASRRRAAGGGSTTTIVNKVEAGKSPARRAGKPRRKPARRTAAKKSAPRRKRAATRRAAPRTTRVVRTSTTTTAYRNPMGKGNGTVKMLAIGMVSTAVGFGSAEVLDRLIATRAGQDKAGTAGRITGYGAILVRSNVPDVYRYASAGGGTLVLGAATWAAAKYTRSDVAVSILGGLTFGFGLKALALGVQHVLPYILPVTSISEDSWQNQLFPENFFKETQPTAAQMQGATFGGARRFGTGAVAKSDFGPTAGGQTGCGCSRCSGAQNSPKAQAPQAPSARQAEPAAAAKPGSVIEIQNQPGADGSVGQPPNNVTPIRRGSSMAEVLGIKE